MNRKGQTAVETALILPLLLLLVLGIMEFGRGFFLKNTLNNAARVGSRYASTLNPWDVTKVQDYTITTGIYSNIKADFIRSNIAVTINDSAGNPLTAPRSGLGDVVTVTVTWNNFKPLTFSYMWLGMNITHTLRGQASMLYE
jgi:Flp pilus assembly protein TadG